MNKLAVVWVLKTLKTVRGYQVFRETPCLCLQRASTLRVKEDARFTRQRGDITDKITVRKSSHYFFFNVNIFSGFV